MSREIDLHIVALIALNAVIVTAFHVAFAILKLRMPSFYWWSIFLLVVLPQIRILEQVFSGLPSLKKPTFRYFVVNEILLTISGAVYILLNAVFAT